MLFDYDLQKMRIDYNLGPMEIFDFKEVIPSNQYVWLSFSRNIHAPYYFYLGNKVSRLRFSWYELWGFHLSSWCSTVSTIWAHINNKDNNQQMLMMAHFPPSPPPRCNYSYYEITGYSMLRVAMLLQDRFYWSPRIQHAMDIPNQSLSKPQLVWKPYTLMPKNRYAGNDYIYTTYPYRYHQFM